MHAVAMEEANVGKDHLVGALLSHLNSSTMVEI